MKQCPKCEYELTMAEQVSNPEQCPSCDIYFAKYQVRMEREKAQREEAEKKALREKAAARAKVKVVTPEQHFGGRLYCNQCGTVSNGVRHVPGSILIELVLWLCMLLPGLIYSIWRHAAQRKACPACKHSDLIPIRSPKARKALDF